MNDKISIYQHSTGETIVREMTNDEQAQRDAEVAAWLQTETDKQAEAEAKREAVEGKLAALGLTVDDLKALGL